MTAVDFDLELVVLEGLAADMEIPCELGDAYKPDCDHPAEWVFHRACCGSHSLGCQECKDLRVANLIAVECPSCLTIHEDSASAYMLIEPLDRRLK